MLLAKLMRPATRILPFLAVALVAGCGGSSSHQTTPPVKRQNDHVPAGYRLRTVPEDGFSIAFPRRWQVVNHYDVLNEPGIVSSLSRIYPKISNQVTAVAEDGSPVKLVGFDVSTARSTPTTVSVIVATPPRGSFDVWTKSVAKDVRTGSGRGVRVTERSVQLPAGRALVLSYSRRVSGTRVTSVHAFVVRGGRMFIVTVTSAHRAPALLERIARTLTVTGVAPPDESPGIPDPNAG
jgi:hypothetical protein